MKPPHERIHGMRTERSRERRGRGHRGPLALAGPLSPRSVPLSRRSRREQFDHVVAAIVTALDAQIRREPEPVEVVVEEAPLLPPEWTDEIPASIVTTAPGGHRIVIYRLVVTSRSSGPEHLEENLWSVLLHRFAEIWQLPPEDIDPR